MKNKAKRVITEFNFDEEGSAIHLVSKKQGGPANGIKTLIKKAAGTAELPEPDDMVTQKLEQVKVTMSMEEFLRKFFYLWEEDAALLTALLGFQTEEEFELENYPSPAEYKSSIKDKLAAFEVMKSMYEQNYENVSASDIVTVLELQERIEKQLNEEMMTTITIQKSRLEELEATEKELSDKLDIVKSLEGQVEQLQSELETIKKAQADAEIEVMQARLKELLVAEDKIERMAKSLLAMDKESQEDFIATLEAKKTALEESDLFVEKSAQGEPEVKDSKELFADKLTKALSGEAE